MKEYNPLGFRISEISHLLKKCIEKRVQKEGISATQMKIFKLLTISEHKNFEVTQNDVCEFTKFKASTISVALKEMEDLGYINRTKSKDDQRKTIIKLTEEGKKKASEIIKIFDSIEELLSSALTEEESKNLSIILSKLHDSLKEDK